MIKPILIILLIISTSVADVWETFTTDNSELPSDTVRVSAIFSDGIKWFGTDRGLAAYDGNSWKVFTTDDNLINNRINDLAHEPGIEGYKLWIATDGGVSFAVVTSFENIYIDTSYTSENSDLVSNHVRAVALDPNRVKWFGTDQGVSMLTDQTWQQATEQDFLSSNLVNDIESNELGMVHIATTGGGVARLKLDEIDGITSASTINSTWSWLLSDTILALKIEQEEVRWFGTGEGAFLHLGTDIKTNWTIYQESDGLIRNHVKTISDDSSGNMWFGTDSGASLLEGTEFRNYTGDNGLAGNDVHDIAVDQNGDIWFASNSGVSRLTYVPSGIENQTIPEDFYFTNYPNPFNNGTILRFNLHTPAKVDIRLFNLLGENVNHIVQPIFPKGNHKIYWDGTDYRDQKLPTGIYFAVISYLGHIHTHKLILVK